MAEEKQCASASTCGKSSCEGCPSKSGAGSKANPFEIETNPNSRVKHVIGIVSGKGGVGKSFVTGTLAGQLVRKGYNVGILDADITGPSIPKMFGVHGPAVGDDNGTYPIVAEDGTKIMSINLLLDDEESPVIWRGPVIAGAVKQFWTDVQWEDVDYLLVDMPPGTGDVPLTCFQSLPLDGIIIVTSPQELVGLIVKKAYNMAGMMNVPVLGVVENYSYVECSDCGKHINIFGESHIEETAAELGLKVLGKLPLNASYAASVDAGRVFDIDNKYIAEAADVVSAL